MSPTLLSLVFTQPPNNIYSFILLIRSRYIPRRVFRLHITHHLSSLQPFFFDPILPLSLVIFLVYQRYQKCPHPQANSLWEPKIKVWTGETKPEQQTSATGFSIWLNWSSLLRKHCYYLRFLLLILFLIV